MSRVVHRTLRAIAMTIALMGASLWVVPATAQDDSLETAKRQELELIRQRAQENREAAKRLRGQESKALVRLKRTDRELRSTRKRLQALQQRQRSLGQQLRVTRVDFQRSVLSLQQQKAQLSRRLRNLYKYGVGRELEFLLSPRSFAQLLARWDFLVMVAEQDRVLLEDVMAKKELVEANQHRIESNITTIKTTATRASLENNRLAGLRRERASSVHAIQSQRQAYEAAAAELEKTARATQRLIAQLERRRKLESERARAEGRAPQPYTGDFAKGQGRLDWPVRGSVVGRFGPEKHPRWGTTTLNNGVDIEVPIGSAVHAVAKGRVDYTSEDFGAFGQIVILNHGDGYYTLYGHLSQIRTSVGQEVQPGQVIAQSGETGSLKGPILHFEVRKGGTPLNPQDWLQ